MQVAATIEDQFSQLGGRLRGKNAAVAGDLIVTTLSGLSPQFTPMLVEFQKLHPEVRIRLVEDERPLKLEYGEAHVALRAGRRPEEPDNVVQLLCRESLTLYAHKSYVEEHGLILNDEDAQNHFFVMPEGSSGRAPFSKWAQQYIKPESVLFRSKEMNSLTHAIDYGGGIGFLMASEAEKNKNLIQMMPPRPEWDTVIWLVTHVDLHRSLKVQEFLKFLKSKFPKA